MAPSNKRQASGENQQRGGQQDAQERDEQGRFEKGDVPQDRDRQGRFESGGQGPRTSGQAGSTPGKKRRGLEEEE